MRISDRFYVNQWTSIRYKCPNDVSVRMLIRDITPSILSSSSSEDVGYVDVFEVELGNIKLFTNFIDEIEPNPDFDLGII